MTSGPSVNAMNLSTKHLILVSAVTVLSVSAVFAPAQAKKQKPVKAAAVTYKQVQGIFDKNCLNCHKAPKPKAELNLESYDGVMKGNDDGSVITPGKPDQSLLFKLITSTGRKHMPPGPKPIDAADIKSIETWIKTGAKGK